MYSYVQLCTVMYSYVLVTNNVSRLYSVAAVLCLQFVLHVMLFRMLQYVM